MNFKFFLAIFIIVFSSISFGCESLESEIRTDYHSFRQANASHIIDGKVENISVAVAYIKSINDPRKIAAILGSACGIGFNKARKATPEEKEIMFEKLAFATNKLSYDRGSCKILVKTSHVPSNFATNNTQFGLFIDF